MLDLSWVGGHLGQDLCAKQLAVKLHELASLVTEDHSHQIAVENQSFQCKGLQYAAFSKHDVG